MYRVRVDSPWDKELSFDIRAVVSKTSEGYELFMFVDRIFKTNNGEEVYPGLEPIGMGSATFEEIAGREVDPNTYNADVGMDMWIDQGFIAIYFPIMDLKNKYGKILGLIIEHDEKNKVITYASLADYEYIQIKGKEETPSIYKR